MTPILYGEAGVYGVIFFIGRSLIVLVWATNSVALVGHELRLGIELEALDKVSAGAGFAF